MSSLDDIKPRSLERVIDLVEKAGFDVSDWANYKGHPSQNPKYCYEWTFIDPNRGVILNLWHPLFVINDGIISLEGNYKEDEKLMQKAQWKARARKMDEAVRTSWEAGLPVQVIMLDGTIRDREGQKSSSVNFRSLDEQYWHVEKYDKETGSFKLVRGTKSPGVFIDQFSIPDIGKEVPERKSSSTNNFYRDPKVRNWVLSRANGFCEYCGDKGFKTTSGKIYLETHHIIALCDNGTDLITNVIGLCPNDHKRAHFGEDDETLKKAFLEIVTQKLNNLGA